jgi:hypothetical protein
MSTCFSTIIFASTRKLSPITKLEVKRWASSSLFQIVVPTLLQNVVAVHWFMFNRPMKPLDPHNISLVSGTNEITQ